MATSPTQRPHPNQKLLGEFIVAAAQNHSKATYLVKIHPELLEARTAIGESALHYVSIENSLEGVEFLIAHGANPNTADNMGSTPIHHANRLQHGAIIALLQSHGAVAVEHGEPPVTPEDMDRRFETSAHPSDDIP